MSATGARSPFPDSGHDHRHCIENALSCAEQLCHERRTRLTAQRREVLELVWQSHRPIGAYAILDALQARGQRVAPPTVYRALEFLLEQGLIHRIESLNAYTGCDRPEEDHDGQFLVCRRCWNAVELHDKGIEQAVAETTRQHGFQVERRTIELSGLCPLCRQEGHDGA